MILIASAGRSGTAWLCSLFTACGLRARHDYYPASADHDVEANTAWLWDVKGFCDWLVARHQQYGVCDSVILLSRPREEIENSVAKLLGRKENWDRVFKQWEELQDKVWNHGLTQILRSAHKVDYVDMFKPEFKDKVRHILSPHEYWGASSRIDDSWNFLRNMRICNKAVEQETIDSYGPLIRN